MRKIFLLILFVAVAFTTGWVADNAGEFQLNWLGWQIEGSVAFLLIVLLVVSCLIWLILHLVNTLLHLPSEVSKERSRLMNEKGLQQLTQAMIAVSESDTKQAKKHLTKAHGLLPDSPLPRLLQLQLAGRQKDMTLAHQQFIQLQRYDATKPLALRGLAEQARAQGDMDGALVRTEALLKEAPNQASTQKLAIDIFSYHRRWQEALKIADRAYAQRHINGDEYRRIRATIGMQQASGMLEDKNRQGAMEMLKKTTATDPSLQPAILQYAQLLKQVGKTSQAAKVLRSGWKYAPHPDIAQAHAELYTDLSEDKQIRKARELAKQNSDAIESQILLADVAMRQSEWDSARNYLKIGLSKQNTVTLCRMMAQLYKKGYGDEAEEHRWLEKAVTAVPDASWQCTHCGAKPKAWRAHCKECHDFASIHWQPETFVAG